MSYRQAQGGVEALFYRCQEFGVKKVALSGYSILRGLTFIELQLDLDDEVDLRPVSQAALMHFIVGTEGMARGGESDEFALVFAEIFPAGRDYEPEPVLLPADTQTLGIGGTDERLDNEWAGLLSRYYNPAAREPNEVQFRKKRLCG